MSYKKREPYFGTGVFVSGILEKVTTVFAILSLLLVSVFGFGISPVVASAQSWNRNSGRTGGNCALKISAVPVSGTVVSGGNINYEVTVTNTSQTNCADTELTEYYPTNEKYESSNIKPSMPSFYWLVGNLGAGQSYPLSLVTANVTDGTSVVANTVCVSATGVKDICVDNNINVTAPTPVQPPAPPSPPTSGITTEGWIYPGNPACGASTTYDGNQIDTLKPEYYQVQSDGMLSQLTASSAGCNGYSVANAADIKAHSTYQYATVSGDYSGVHVLLASVSLQSAAISTLTNFAVYSGFTGIELDWEQFGNWTSADYTNYKTFTTALQNSLHANGKLLMIDAPAIYDSTSQGYQLFKYEDFTNIDYVAIMAYDYQYDYGVGEPVAPLSWITSIVNWAKARLPVSHIVIGIPAYGYHGALGSYNMTIDTYAQSSVLPGFSTRKLNSDGEEFWTVGNTYYCDQSQSALDGKETLLKSLGIQNVSVWHLGGNNWF